METPTSIYQYPSRLPPGQIRVLQKHPDQSLHTASGVRLGHFTFQIVPLASEFGGPPDQDYTKPLLYTALSYFWGDQTVKYKIAIDYTLFEVGINLFVAICHLLRQFTPPYWIDAICINQNDPAEKRSQVIRMRDVYRDADRVVVWLGPGDAEYRKAITQIDEIGAEALQKGIEDFTAENMKQWPDFGTDARLNDIRTDLEQTMKSSQLGQGFPVGAFLDIMDNVWFERAWVVQELSLPLAGSVTFLCGKDQISYEHLAAGYKLFLLWYGVPLRSFQVARFLPRRFRSRLGIYLRPPNARAGTTLGFRKKFMNYDDGIPWKELLTFSYTLDSAKSLQCQEPVDKIYALMGMARDTGFLDQAQASDAQPHQEVYTSIARHLISGGNLDILGLCCSPNRDNSLPSWVPDWTKPMRPPWGLYKEDGLFQAGLQISIDSSACFSKLNTLTLRGWHVDTIKDVGAIWRASLDSFDWIAAKDMLESVDFFLEKSTFYDPKNLPDLVWRIPIGNKEQNRVMQVISATSESCGAFNEMKKELRRRKPGSRVYGAAFTSYMNMMWSMHESRPFFSTKGYVGLCPATAGPGDEIYCIAGGHVPYVFRKSTAGGHELVGEAYVQGIMHGEFFPEAAAETLLEIH